MEIFYELEHDFFHHRILDPDAWLALAEEFDSRDRIYGAAAARRRLAIFQEIFAEEEDNNKLPERRVKPAVEGSYQSYILREGQGKV
jgi:hypothetical protein